MHSIKLDSVTKAKYREPLSGHKLVMAVVAAEVDSPCFSVLMPRVPTREGLGAMLEAIVDTWQYHTGEKLKQ
jgi:hypothetical protein